MIGCYRVYLLLITNELCPLRVYSKFTVVGSNVQKLSETDSIWSEEVDLRTSPTMEGTASRSRTIFVETAVAPTLENLRGNACVRWVKEREKYRALIAEYNRINGTAVKARAVKFSTTRAQTEGCYDSFRYYQGCGPGLPWTLKT